VRPYLEKSPSKKDLVEWLKVKALRSNPSTKKKIVIILDNTMRRKIRTTEKEISRVGEENKN
jgi:hypothetical protein